MTAVIILTVFSAVLTTALIVWVMFWVGFYTGQRFERGERTNSLRRINLTC